MPNPNSNSTTGAAAPRWRGLGQLGLIAQGGVVAGAVLAVWLFLAPWSYLCGGAAGLLAAAVAAATRR